VSKRWIVREMLIRKELIDSVRQEAGKRGRKKLAFK
jgi:hypothetical protein